VSVYFIMIYGTVLKTPRMGIALAGTGHVDRWG